MICKNELLVVIQHQNSGTEGEILPHFTFGQILKHYNILTLW